MTRQTVEWGEAGQPLPDYTAKLCWSDSIRFYPRMGRSVGPCDKRASTDVGLCRVHYEEVFGEDPVTATKGRDEMDLPSDTAWKTCVGTSGQHRREEEMRSVQKEGEVDAADV